MATILHLETERARQVLQRLKRLAFEMEQITSVLGNEARRLNAVWDGPSSEEFLSQFHIWHQQWRRLPDELLRLFERGFREIEEWESAGRSFGFGNSGAQRPSLGPNKPLPPLGPKAPQGKGHDKSTSPLEEWIAFKQEEREPNEAANLEGRKGDASTTKPRVVAGVREGRRTISLNLEDMGRTVKGTTTFPGSVLESGKDLQPSDFMTAQREQTPHEVSEVNVNTAASENTPEDTSSYDIDNSRITGGGSTTAGSAAGGGTIAGGTPVGRGGVISSGTPASEGTPGTSAWDPSAVNQGQREVASAVPPPSWGNVDPLMGEALHDQVEPLSEAPPPKGAPRGINPLLIGTGLIGGTALAGTAYYLFRSQQDEQEPEDADPTQVVPDDTIAYWQQWMNEDLPDEAIEGESTLDANTQILDVNV